jgi:Mg2+-importing ATPase
MIPVTATVVRDGKPQEIPLRDLVPGDIINLSAGGMIPGDVRILSAKDLFVSQGTLTGESLPVEKFHDADPNAANSPVELKNICFMGTAFKAEQRPQSLSLRGFIGDLGNRMRCRR